MVDKKEIDIAAKLAGDLLARSPATENAVEDSLKASEKLFADVFSIQVQAKSASRKINLQFMEADGKMLELSPARFRALFGVTYLRRLVLVEEHPFQLRLPPLGNSQISAVSMTQDERERLQKLFGRSLVKPQDGSKIVVDEDLVQWLYADKVRQFHTANIFLAQVDEKVGYGAFAGTDLKPGEMIGEYTGIARKNDWSPGSSDWNNPYLFAYKRRGFSIDASEMGNHKRFINHSESQPNVQALEIDIDDLRHVILIASQEIKKGQQILFNYGESYWAEEEQPRDLK